MQAIYRSKPLMRIVSMMLVVSLTLCAVGAIQQQSNAFVGTLVLGGAVLLGLGSMLLLALGITYANEDAMVEGAHTLMSAGSVNGQALEYVVDGVTYVVDTIGELLQHDAQTTGKVVYQAPTNSYKFKATISDSTWQAARAWVNNNYNPGEITAQQQSGEDGVSVSIATTADFYYNVDGSSSNHDLLPAEVRYMENNIEFVWRITSSLNESTNCKDVTYKKFKASDPSVILESVIVPDAISCRMKSMTYDGIENKLFYGEKRDTTQYWAFHVPKADILSFKWLLTSSYVDVVVGSAAADVVDNDNYDYVNGVTGARDVSVDMDVVSDLAGADVVVDDNIGLSVDEDKYVQDVVGGSYTDVVDDDLSGVEAAEDTTTSSLAQSIWDSIASGIGSFIRNTIGTIFGWLYELLTGILALFTGLFDGIGSFFTSIRAVLAGFGSSYDVSPFNQLIKDLWLLMPMAVQSVFLLLISVVVLFGVVKKL